MDRERLTALLSNPGEVARQDLQDLQDLAQRFPWFSGARLLLAVGEDKAGDVLSNDRATAAAAHLPSPAVLFDLNRKDSPRPQAPMHVVRDAADLDVVNLLEAPDRHQAASALPTAAELPPPPTLPAPMDPAPPPALGPVVAPSPTPAATAAPPVGPTPGHVIVPNAPPAPPEPEVPPPAPGVDPAVEQAPDPLSLLYREAAASAPYDLGQVSSPPAKSTGSSQHVHALAAHVPAPANTDPLAYLYRETEAAPIQAPALPVASPPAPPPPLVPALSMPSGTPPQQAVPEQDIMQAVSAQELPQHARFRFSTWLDMATAATTVPAAVPGAETMTSAPVARMEPETDRSIRTIRPGLEELPSTEEILERFIQRPETGTAPQKTAFFTPQLAAKRSLQDEGLVSETLGKIHEAQGNHAKAMEVYTRLAQLHPDKSVYFAALLKALEGRTNK
jgi:hypothetical protein